MVVITPQGVILLPNLHSVDFFTEDVLSQSFDMQEDKKTS